MRSYKSFIARSLVFIVFVLLFSPSFANSVQTSSVQRVDFSASTGLLGFVDGTDRSKDWAKYYGDGLAYLDSFANVGSTVTLKWRVSSDGLKPLANTAVQILVNKACSSSNGKLAPINGVIVSMGACGTDGAVIKTNTDANGEVSITLTNTNSEVEGEKRPDTFSKVSTASQRRYSQISLIIKDQLKESIDIVDIHWVKKGSDSVVSSTPSSGSIIWRQEFNGRKNSKVDPKYWNYDLGGDGWGNGELQNYQRDAVTMDGSGNLVIVAKRINANKKAFCFYGLCDFSSGRILTKGKLAFKYGKIEAKIKMPAGRGTWPAFWSLGSNITTTTWPNCGEIDIVEASGNNPTWISYALHGPEYSGGSYIGRSFYSKNALSKSFHTYGILWAPREISWTLDGAVMHTVNKAFIGDKTWVFDDPQFLLLNIAMGGTHGGEVPPKFSSSKMYIDWIRVSKIGKYGELIRY